MLRWLPGADLATRDEGERFTARAMDLYKKHVVGAMRRKVTIAVSVVAGMEVAVVYHVVLKTAERLAGRLRKAGVAATATSGDDHAEVELHKREPAVQAIGISNPGGPCNACGAYFGSTPTGFANVYWDSDGWIKQ